MESSYVLSTRLIHRGPYIHPLKNLISFYSLSVRLSEPPLKRETHPGPNTSSFGHSVLMSQISLGMLRICTGMPPERAHHLPGRCDLHVIPFPRRLFTYHQRKARGKPGLSHASNTAFYVKKRRKEKKSGEFIDIARGVSTGPRVGRRQRQREGGGKGCYWVCC